MPDYHMIHSYRRRILKFHTQRTAALLWIGIFAATGAGLLLRTHAQTPTTSVEPEQGTISAPAIPKTDSTASGGSSVKFGTVVIPPLSGLKPQIPGVISRDIFPPSAWQTVVNGYVVAANWSDLQPTQGSAIASNNIFDQTIAKVQALNTANPGLNMHIKLRVYAGRFAPNWAKILDGFTPITITDGNGTNPVTGTIGPFWHPSYEQAYASLQAALAAKYDNAPEIEEVAITACSTIYGEPMIRQMSLAANVTAYLAAGYNLADDSTCQHAQIDAHKVWVHTRSSLAFNPYQQINADGTTKIDVNFTNSLMDYCRSTLGSQRCILGNNSIDETVSSTGATNPSLMYAHMKALGAPIYYQTAASAKFTDPLNQMVTTLNFAISQGAGMVEIPDKFTTTYPLDYFSSSPNLFDQRLTALAQQ